MLVILPVTETVVVSSLWLVGPVGLVGLADTVVVKLGREWYVKEEEAVAPLSKMLFVLLLMLVVDDIAGNRLLCSPLPGTKNIYLHTMKNLV